MPADRIPVGFSLEIKHAIGDLCSALDYVAKEIQDRLEAESKAPLKGFPVALSPAMFADMMESRFPGIDQTFSKSRAVLESCQDYKLTSEKRGILTGPWLVDLHTLWNESKHSALTFHSYHQTNFQFDPEVDSQITQRTGDRLCFDLITQPIFEFLPRCRKGVEELLARVPETVGWTPEEELKRVLQFQARASAAPPPEEKHEK